MISLAKSTVTTYFAEVFKLTFEQMTIMKQILRAVSVAAVLAVATAWAQPGGPGGGMGNMARFFGDNKAFTATVISTVKSSQAGTMDMDMEMEMSMLDGKIRMEMDITKMKAMAARAAQMKQMGMDKMVNIMRPDKKVVYIVYPNLQAYAENVLTDEQAANMLDTTSKIEKTSMGKETIDGHPCEKNKVTVTSEKGEKQDVMVWNATDMKGFPIQMQMSANGNDIVMKYTNVKLDKPDAKLFEAPTGFTKYNSPQTMMQTEMMKRAGGGGPGSK